MRQWVPLQRQLVPRAKDAAEAYRRNARSRQREAVRSALRRGHLKTLDRDLILEQWRRTEERDADDQIAIEAVLRVSLPSSRVQAMDEVALLSCPRLRICSLPDCYVKDISALYGCGNLLKLDLSDNQVSYI